MNTVYRIAITLFIITFLYSCKKDENSLPDKGSSQASGQKITTSISGFIKDIHGNPVAGALVTAGNKSSVTNSSGAYLINDVSVSAHRAVIEVNKAGYWKQQKGIIAEPDATNRGDLMLFPETKAYSLNSSSGGTITLAGGSSIIFPANAFSYKNGNLYTGTVYITAYDLITSSQNFPDLIPGGDLLAKDQSGEETLLASYGMAGAKLFDASGNELVLSSGKQAVIKFLIDPGQAGIAPATIPLWHFNESLEMWKEEGVAIKNGNFYEGSVAHFSWWNCDLPVQSAALAFQLFNCNTYPLSNYKILISAVGFGTTSGTTNSSGNCQGVVPANQLLFVQILNPITHLADTSFTTGPFAHQSSQNIQLHFTVGNCNLLNVNLTDCSGNTLNGSVMMLNNGNIVSIQATTNGTATVGNLVPGTYHFYATSGQLSGRDSIIINGSSQASLQLTISLCDTVQPATNNFHITISNPALGTWNVSQFNVTSGYEMNNGVEHVILKYIDPLTMDSGYMNITSPDYLTGTYTWYNPGSRVDGIIFYNGQTYSLTSAISVQGAWGYTNLVETPMAGSNLIGGFAGSMILDGGGIYKIVNVNADFDALRTY